MVKKTIILIILLLVFISGGYFCRQKIMTMRNNTAVIVFTSDKTYKDYLKVALKSAILNKNPKSVYDINILCVDLTEKEMQEYNSMAAENVKITTIPLQIENIKIGNFPISNIRVSRADLYKFFMPEILKQYDKILYIDSDTLILRDLLELYNTNLSGKYLGAVLKYAAEFHWEKVLGLFWVRVDEYDYNCGVMLMNLAKMRKDNIPLKLIESKNADTERHLMTQNAFNDVLPLSKIKKLSPVYNLVSRWKPVYFKSYNFKKNYAPYLRNINSMDELYKEAVIVHYAGYRKPWYYPDVAFGKEWWKYAKMVNKNWKTEKDPRRDLVEGNDLNKPEAQ